MFLQRAVRWVIFKCMFLRVNALAIIFLNVDRRNGFNTLAYDYATDRVFLIKPPEYHFLLKLNNLVKTSVDSARSYRSKHFCTQKETDELIADLCAKNILLVEE